MGKFIACMRVLESGRPRARNPQKPLPYPDFTRWRRPLRLATWTLIILFIAAFSLELGIWTRQETIIGPFTAEAHGSQAYIVAIGPDMRFRWLFTTSGDDLRDSTRSDLRLWVNGNAWGPPHSAHDLIRLGDTRAFSHWYDNLYFSLPIDLARDQRTVLTVVYSVRLHPLLLNALFFTALTAILLRFWQNFRSGVLNYKTAHLLVLFRLTIRAVIAVVMFYLATILYGLLLGHALPTATVFRILPATKVLAAAEPLAPFAILGFAGLGTGISWLATLRILPNAEVRRNELILGRILERYGFIIILSIFIFSVSSGGWSGQVRALDLNYMSLAGLVPHSDAYTYFVDILDQSFARENWSVQSSWRPFAAAFRQLTVFVSQYSYTGVILVQASLVSASLYVAARALARWRGIWAGIAFVGLIYIVGRVFLLTTLTEPLALIWILFALAFFIESLRLRSALHAIVALFSTTIALLIRMENFFFVVFLVFWFTFVFTSANLSRRDAFAFASVAVVVALTLNSLLAFVYGAGGLVSGENFAYTLCGLSLGGSSPDCASKYAAITNNFLDWRLVTSFLFSQTWQNISANPEIFISKLGHNLTDFIGALPRFYAGGGYMSSLQLTQIQIQGVMLALLPGVYYALRHRASSAERTFWLGLFTTAFLSASIIYADDGLRVFHVSESLIACFIALGFTAPAVVTINNNVPTCNWRTGFAIGGSMLTLFFFAPQVAGALADREIASHRPIGSPGNNEHIVLAGRRLAGFIVVADEADVSPSVPTLRVSEFIKLVQLVPLAPKLRMAMPDMLELVPFAFVVGTRIDDGRSQEPVRRNYFYLAPPSVLNERDVWAWRFTFTRLLPNEQPGDMIIVKVTAMQRVQ